MFYFEVVGQSAIIRLWKWTKNKQRSIIQTFTNVPYSLVSFLYTFARHSFLVGILKIVFLYE